MSLIDMMTPRRRGRALTVRPPDPSRATVIAAEIAKLEQETRVLAAARPVAALDAVNGIAAGAVLVNDIDAETSTLNSRLALLHSALDAANSLDYETHEAERSRLRAAQIAGVRQHLEQRDEAAAAMSAALEEAVRQFRKMLDHSRQAEAARPAGEPWPDGSVTDAEALRRLADIEVARLDKPDRLPQFPRGAVPMQPDLRPLPEKLSIASRHVLDELSRPAPARRGPNGRH